MWRFRHIVTSFFWDKPEFENPCILWIFFDSAFMQTRVRLSCSDSLIYTGHPTFRRHASPLRWCWQNFSTVPQGIFFSKIIRPNSSSGTPEWSLLSEVRNAHTGWWSMALTHVYIYTFTCMFLGNTNFILWLCDFLILPHPVYHIYFFGVGLDTYTYTYLHTCSSVYQFYSMILRIFFWFWIHTASAPITAGTHTDRGAVIK